MAITKPVIGILYLHFNTANYNQLFSPLDCLPNWPSERLEAFLAFWLHNKINKLLLCFNAGKGLSRISGSVVKRIHLNFLLGKHKLFANMLFRISLESEKENNRKSKCRAANYIISFRCILLNQNSFRSQLHKSQINVLVPGHYDVF